MSTPISPALSGYSRVGPRVHRVAALAEAIAQSHGHEHVGALHLALGLLDEGQGVAVTALQFHRVSLSTLRAEIERLLPPAADIASDAKRLALAPDAQAVFTAAFAEAEALDHHYLATEHILLGLLSDPTTAVARLLAARGFNLPEARARIRWILEGDPRDPTTYTSPRAG